MGEKIVLRPQNGAIASWSASRISFPTQNASLLYLLVPRMINQNYSLGKAIMDAKIAYTSDPYNESVYVLMGDPHLRINPPQPYTGINPVFQGEDEVFNSRETVEFSGVFSSAAPINGTVELIAYDTDNQYRLDNVNVSERVSRSSGEAFLWKITISLELTLFRMMCEPVILPPSLLTFGIPFRNRIMPHITHR